MSATLQIDSEWPGTLIALLENQQEIVQRLSALSDRQAKLISAAREHDADQLLHLLSQRQTIIDEFTSSQERMSDLTRDLERKLAGVAERDRSRITQLIDSIGVSLGEVLRRDEADQAALRSARDEVKGSLASLKPARAANTAYAAPPPSQPPLGLGHRSGIRA